MKTISVEVRPDHLQLAKWNGTWKIVNVLYELKPEPAAR
jgi:hypothetical protein